MKVVLSILSFLVESFPSIIKLVDSTKKNKKKNDEDTPPPPEHEVVIENQE